MSIWLNSEPTFGTGVVAAGVVVVSLVAAVVAYPGLGAGAPRGAVDRPGCRPVDRPAWYRAAASRRFWSHARNLAESLHTSSHHRPAPNCTLLHFQPRETMDIIGP